MYNYKLSRNFKEFQRIRDELDSFEENGVAELEQAIKQTEDVKRSITSFETGWCCNKILTANSQICIIMCRSPFLFL